MLHGHTSHAWPGGTGGRQIHPRAHWGQADTSQGTLGAGRYIPGCYCILWVVSIFLGCIKYNFGISRQPDQPDQPDQAVQGKQANRADRADWADQADRADQADQAHQGEQPDHVYIFSYCTCTHHMLRFCQFLCICTHAGCCTSSSSLALMHMRDVKL